ncbi:MAG: YihY/virulence factor BrkB family protein [Bacteroidota bacterium]
MKKFEQRLVKLAPVAYLVNKSKHLILPGFEGSPLFEVIQFFRQQITKIGFNLRAAAISFNVLMALPAGLIFLCTLVPYLPTAVHFERELIRTIAQLLKDTNTLRLVADVIHDFFGTQRNGLLSFSFAAAIFFSSNAMMGIMRTFDRSYFEERSGKFLAKRWTAIRLTSFLILLFFSTVLLLATQGPIRSFFLKTLNWDKPVVKSLIDSARWIVIILLNYFTIAFIYRWAPAVKNRWSLISPGAILATILTFFTSWLFSTWVNNFGQLNKVYGSIGTVLIIMNLVYINSLVLLIGFELNVGIMAVKAKRMLAEAAAGKITAAEGTNQNPN